MDREVLVNLGLAKYKMCKEERGRFFIRSILAGLYLGMATILSYTFASLLMESSPVMAKVTFSFTFGIGLVAICLLGAELFTGNCFTSIMPVYDKKLKFTQILPMWVICYIGNFIGIVFVCFLFVKSGSNFPALKEYMRGVMEAKMVFDPMELLIKGILCNFIVCIAGYSGIKIKNEAARIIMIVVIVAAFVLPGFEHSIANMGGFTLGFGALGSAIPFDWVPLHMVLSTLGNMIGGSILLGLPVYLSIKEK